MAMPLKPTAEQLIERWMLTIVSDGGIARFDDLHIDQINEQWKDRRVWISAGLEAYRIAVALRNQHQLPFVVALGFSLQASTEAQGSEFHTAAEFAERLDWSPPSLYLFQPDTTPSQGAQVAAEPCSPAIGTTIQDLPSELFGREVSAKRTYRIRFKSEGSEEYSQSVFVEG